MKIIQIFLSFFLALITYHEVIIAAPSEFYDKQCFRRKKGKKIALVQNGKALCPILISPSCSPRTRDAVEELKIYFKKISGADFKIEIANPKVLPDRAIWIGYHKSFDKIFKNVDAELELEEIRIIANENHLAIFGDDGPEGIVQDIVIEGDVFANAQASYGTINAIYTFIQDFLGVRWFWPGDLGEDYNETKNITIDPVDFKYQPQFIARYGVLGMLRPGRRPRMSDGDQWSARQRLFYSSTLINFGHPFKGWWNKYSERFPDIFALNEKGNRIPVNLPENVKFCMTNTDFHKLWLTDLDSVLKDNPFIRYINIGENDSYNSGHCTCENCTKLDAVSIAEKEKNLSDRNVYLANKLSQLIEDKFGKNNKYHILYSAYGNNRPLPIKHKLNANIGVVSVANFHLRRKDNLDSKQNLHIEQYLNWSKQSNTLFWRPNLGDPVGLSWGFYDVAFSQSFENFKFVAVNNCKGVFFDLYREHWSTQGIQYYVDAQLAWNPNLNKEALLDDYFLRFYGPAKSEMRTFWSLVENSRNLLYKEHGDVARFFIFEAFNEAWFSDAESLLQSAEKKLLNGPKKFLNRLKYTRQGFQYARFLVNLRKSIYESEQGSDKAKNFAFKIIEDIQLWSKSIEPYAINLKVLNFDTDEKFEAKLQKRMEGLLPNAPLKKKTLRMMDEGLE